MVGEIVIHIKSTSSSVTKLDKTCAPPSTIILCIPKLVYNLDKTSCKSKTSTTSSSLPVLCVVIVHMHFVAQGSSVILVVILLFPSSEIW
jgi:hypothetical protein